MPVCGLAIAFNSADRSIKPKNRVVALLPCVTLGFRRSIDYETLRVCGSRCSSARLVHLSSVVLCIHSVELCSGGTGRGWGNTAAITSSYVCQCVYVGVYVCVSHCGKRCGQGWSTSSITIQTKAESHRNHTGSSIAGRLRLVFDATTPHPTPKYKKAKERKKQTNRRKKKRAIEHQSYLPGGSHSETSLDIVTCAGKLLSILPIWMPIAHNKRLLAALKLNKTKTPCTQKK